MVTTSFFPRDEVGLCLVLDHNALFEVSVEVLAAITAVHWDQHSVQFVNGVFFGGVTIGRHAGVVIEESHF
jgi:hypothetical protein